MEKIVIHLEIPSIQREFDIKVPVFMSVGELTELIVRAIGEMQECHYVSSGNEILCLREKNIMLIHEATIESYAVQNGDHIILI